MAEDANMLSLFDRQLLGAVMIMFSVVTILGSVLVISSVTTHGWKIKSRNNIFINNLLIADFIVGVMTMPITSVSVLQNKWIFGQRVCEMSGFLDNAALVSSLWTMAMSSVDRYYFVTHPFSYDKVMSHKRILLMLFFSWFHSSLLAACPLLGWDKYVYSQYSFNCGFEGSNDAFHRYYFITFFMLAIPVPMFLCTYFYFKLLIITRKKLNSMMKKQRTAFPTISSTCPASTVHFSENTANFTNLYPKQLSENNESTSTVQISSMKAEQDQAEATRMHQHHTTSTMMTSCLPSSDRSSQVSRGCDNSARARNKACCREPCSSIQAENQSVDSMSRQTNRTSSKVRQSRNSAVQRKVTISVFIIVGCYMFFTMPLFITGLIHWVSNHPINIPLKISLLAHWLFVGKSACNPVLLASINPQVQSGFKELMRFFNFRSHS